MARTGSTTEAKSPDILSNRAESQGYSSLYQILLNGINSGELSPPMELVLWVKMTNSHKFSPVEEVRAITHSTDSIWTPNVDDDDYTVW